MKAFALPSFSEGYIRINLQGREPEGLLRHLSMRGLCDEQANSFIALKMADRQTYGPENYSDGNMQPNATRLPDADLGGLARGARY